MVRSIALAPQTVGLMAVAEEGTHAPPASHLSKSLTRSLTSAAESAERPSTPPRRPLARSVNITEGSPRSMARKSAKDLSNLFSFASETADAGPSSIPAKAQGGIARRMLARSRTETTVISISSTSDQGSAGASSVHATPSKLRGFRSDSIIASPSRRQSTPSPSKAQPQDNVSSPPILPTPVNANANVRTYAGTSRSFLVALPQSQAGTLGLDTHAHSLVDDTGPTFGASQEDDFDMRESYKELRERWGVDASEDDPRPVSSVSASPSPKGKGKKRKGMPDDTPVKVFAYGMTNDLKSITELRSKGESRRFLDEVGYLFEGLDAKGALGVRRGSALEIVTKMCDVDFARRAKTTDFLGRAWEVLRGAGAGDGDKVLDTTLAFYAALVARDPTDLLDLAAKSDFTFTLHRMLACLERSNDPLWLLSMKADNAELKAAGITKAETTLLSNLHRLVRKKSGLFDESDTISSRLLMSQALVSVLPSTHRFPQLGALLRTLLSELTLLPSRVDAYVSGLSLFPPPGPLSHADTPSLLHLDNCLRLFDSCLLGSWSVSAEEVETLSVKVEELRQRHLVEGLLALCVSCAIIQMDGELEGHRAVAGKCMESALRVLINLTHDDPEWCQAILDQGSSMAAVMQLVIMAHRQRQVLQKQVNADEGDDADADTAARWLDRMCLALGLLTNLVQALPDAKLAITEILIDFDCPHKRGCVLGCHCPGRTSALTCLVQVYAEHASSSSELDIVVRGHMAILLGLLMEHAPDNQQILLEVLPGTSRREKLSTLLQHAQEFTLFYVALTRKMAQARHRSQMAEETPSEAHEDTHPSAASMRRDSKGEAVAKGVVIFLSKLKDRSS
ncbi:hypothetical protein BN946_scf184748.g27 [Trametes cinnabarina]|uniref:Wings apart-like protein C-terminal domain-containing protein n=1 Tax=Pycnoporus cinnabarinus TaxID=5643 RepID=A0A060SEB2_PYCCI|nr:hypothetical protein BN946_scf184748.g27 [Trametes cinnabarina]